MAKWTMSEALAAELLAGLEEAARARAAGLTEAARQEAAYLGLGWLEEEAGQVLWDLSGLPAGRSRRGRRNAEGWAAEDWEAAGDPADPFSQASLLARSRAAGASAGGSAPGTAEPGASTGTAGKTAAEADMERVSRFFERDARRYG